MKKTVYLFAGLFALILTACGGGGSSDLDFDFLEQTYSVQIDNGLDTSATVIITTADDSTMEYMIAGYGTEDVTLKEGKYHVKATSALDSIFVDEDFEITSDASAYNLNLTKQDYIIENVMYIVSDNPELYTTNESFTYNGKTYDEVDADVVPGALLVAKSWDYNLDQEMPEEVTIYGDNNSTTKSKVYRAETFVLYLELFELFGGMSDEDLENFSEFD
jgi:hypothetical protein